MTAPGNVIATAFVQVLADTRDFSRKLRQDLRQSSRELRALDREIQPVQQSLAFLARTATGIAPGIRLARASFLALAGHAIVGGIVTLGGALAAASGALLVMPAAAVAAASGLGALAVGLFGVGDALKDFEDPEKFAKGVEKLSSNARETLGVLGSLRERIFGVRDAVQDALFADLGDVVGELADTFLPRAEKHFSALATIINGTARDVTAFAQTSTTLADVDEITGNVETAFQALRPAVVPATQAIRDIVTVGSRFLPLVANEVTELSKRFADFITRVRTTGQLQQFIGSAIAAVKQLGIILFNVGRIVASVLSGARASGLGLLDTLQKLTDKAADFLESARGQEQLQRFLTSAREAGQALLPVLASIGDLLFNHLAPVLTSFAKTIGPVVSKFFRGLGDAITIAAPGIRSFAEGFSTLITAIIPALPAIGRLVGAFGELLGALASGFGPAIANVANAIANTLIPIIEALTVVVQLLPDGFFTLVVVIGVVIAAMTSLINAFRSTVIFAQLLVGGFQVLIATVSSAQFVLAGIGSFLFGPWGIALGVAATALGAFALSQSKSTAATQQFTFELDRQTGTLSRASIEGWRKYIESAHVGDETSAKVRDVVKQLGLELDDLVGFLLEDEGAQRRVNKAIREGGQSGVVLRQFLQGQKGDLDAATKAQLAAIEAADRYGGAQTALRGPIGFVNNLLQIQKAVLDELFNAQQRNQQQQLEALNSELAYFNQLDRTNTELNDGALTLDRYTQEGRDNLGVLSQLATAGAQRVANLKEQGASNAEVNALMAQQEQELLDLLSPFFQTREAARAYGVQVGLIPKAPTVTPVFDDTKARQDLTGFAQFIDIITRPRTVKITLDPSGPPLPVPGQLPGENARGGPVAPGTWTWVGEEGPELVRFGRAARVFSADESERMSRDVGQLDMLTTRGGSGNAAHFNGNVHGGSQMATTITVQPQFTARVYVGDREITDIVRVELNERDRALTQLVNVGTGRR